MTTDSAPLLTLQPIATFRSPFGSKFGIPKQSGLVARLPGRIVFQPAFRNADYIRGIDEFDYLWLLWHFSANRHQAASPVVRPPLLGGNKRVGVFATRSPYRPNPIGLSVVKVVSVEQSAAEGPVIHVEGADLMDGTPIFDIKPYLPYADSHPDARGGFTDATPIMRLQVVVTEKVERALGTDRVAQLREVLALDPRPHYHDDPDKVYGMPFYGFDVKFRVSEGIITAFDVE